MTQCLNKPQQPSKTSKENRLGARRSGRGGGWVVGGQYWGSSYLGFMW